MNERKCTFEGCDKPHRALGLCKGHYQQQYTGEALRALRERRLQQGSCAFEGCERKALARGLCRGHYTQQHRGQELHSLERNTVVPPLKCTFEKCEKRHYARGLCSAHYAQQRLRKPLKPLSRGGGRPRLYADTVTAGFAVRVHPSYCAAVSEIAEREGVSEIEAQRMIVAAGVAALRGER